VSKNHKSIYQHLFCFQLVNLELIISSILLISQSSRKLLNRHGFIPNRVGCKLKDIKKANPLIRLTFCIQFGGGGGTVDPTIFIMDWTIPSSGFILTTRGVCL
jgi:hypothetical protein